MSDIFEEIDRELKEERFLNLLKKYLPYLVFLIFIIILSTIVFAIWQNKTSTTQKKNSEIYYNAQNISKNIKDNKQALEGFDYLIKTDQGIYYVLSSLAKAKIMQDSNLLQDAIKIYDDLAKNNKVDIIYRDLSALMAANLIVSYKIQDSNIEQRLTSLTKTENQYYDSAILLKGLYLATMNKQEELITFTNAINGSILPSIRTKLNTLVKAYE